MKKNIIGIIIAIAVCELAGIIGAVFTMPAVKPGKGLNWYSLLITPPFNPPSWIFAPVWTILYALMGIAGFIVWSKGFAQKKVKIALGIFFIQFVLNVLWSFIFFGKQNIGAAFVEIIFLWLAILASIVAFHRISRTAAWILVPYIIWVSFAGYLNYFIWQMNPNAPHLADCSKTRCPAVRQLPAQTTPNSY
jgi:tryptophan-rich sensory protein